MILEYIWVDADGGLRSKTKVTNSLSDTKPEPEELPDWNFDGSSTKQATGENSEINLKPVNTYPDPFRKNILRHSCWLVLCETYIPETNQPHPTNTRHRAVEIFQKAPELEPMFGLEQEFFLSVRGRPIAFPENKNLPPPQGPYYCGIGADNVIGGECVEEAFRNCLWAGLQISGKNFEVCPGQHEIQLCDYGINVSDGLLIMRYIINRTCEKYNLTLDLRPKPIKGDWNGSGNHCNFSDKNMRDPGGYKHILEAIKKLEKRHAYHMERYGEGNRERMTGLHETASYDTFTYGVANRGCSVRIPRSTEKNQCGYFEDRRPASNIDPYVVTSLIFETCCLLD